MKFIKSLIFNMILCTSVFCTKEIGKYKMLDVADYLKNPNHEELNQYYRQDLIIICDDMGEISNFKGTEIENGIYICEEAHELSKLMSDEDKQKTYLRKFNNSLQFWVVKD